MSLECKLALDKTFLHPNPRRVPTKSALLGQELASSKEEDKRKLLALNLAWSSDARRRVEQGEKAVQMFPYTCAAAQKRCSEEGCITFSSEVQTFCLTSFPMWGFPKPRSRSRGSRASIARRARSSTTDREYWAPSSSVASSSAGLSPVRSDVISWRGSFLPKLQTEWFLPYRQKLLIGANLAIYFEFYIVYWCSIKYTLDTRVVPATEEARSQRMITPTDRTPSHRPGYPLTKRQVIPR